MQRAFTIRVLLALVFGIWGPGASSADALFSPWAGVIRGNEPAEGRHTFGWTAGGMRGGFRNLTKGTNPDDLGPVDFGFDLGSLDFWRASIGIVIR